MSSDLVADAASIKANSASSKQVKPTLKERVQEVWDELFGLGEGHALYDRTLVILCCTLLAVGLLMVASASIPVASKLFGNPLHFAIRHLVYLGLSFIAFMAVVQMPMAWWKRFNPYLLMIAFGLLITVLIVGKNVNGSTRWLALGPLNIQAAEPAKLFFFVYLAGYLVRRESEVKENLKGFIKPLLVMFALAVLLLMQPDLGTVVVMFATTVGLLFLAGAKLIQFFALFMTGCCAVVFLILSESYRMRRVTSFLDPWADPFGSGYQLTQSLMAYGRGDWFGMGLGNSIQKLHFLPEAHTDFVFAVLAEETGFIGVMLVVAVVFWLVGKILSLGSRVLAAGKQFEGYFAYAMAIWISFQAAVNIGASAGMLPTKGLTLPLVSYGGSSLLVMSIAIAAIMRIDYEHRLESVQATRSSKKPKKKNLTRNPREEHVDDE
ncbi:cell division protein FtsW [Saccharobesus litoralis]|uniref:Probable peptidoglycan glycosyltransferase FtsW n=1 Tax=Saccharobesus litoralis TaxID=2172099 RepID=A0A2S0VWZ7_9ALTE|nr:cell division protein FtsW [Saccharobesus litoralis]AWB68741.1 cell division protein FtsW [Saccharobesus litoralis]